nr:uncharacterized protein At1g01500 [Ipomoea batatas]
MYVSGRGKDEYLTGEVLKPEETDATYRQWKSENHMVMSWLINSMLPGIGENFLLYHIQPKKFGMELVTPIPVYSWTCPADSTLYKNIVEQKRTFRFLLGLNKDLDQVRGRIMSIRPFPSIRKVFSEVRREESRQKLMMADTTSHSEISAMLTHTSSHDSRPRKGGRPWCEHCKKAGHFRETCWKIHGKPADWKPKHLFLQMGSSHESLTNGKLDDSGLQIIKHPLFYQSYSKSLLSWLDIRVFYIRVSNFVVDGSTPGSLTLNHIPLSPDTLLEVNGSRCSMHSEGASCVLRRDRVDKKSEEATFVSTDSIRLTGSVKFEVFDRDDLVLSGVLEISNSNGVIGESKNGVRKWKMNCEPVMSAGSGFLKGKHITGSDSPTIEVYVAGCFSGTPIILTKTLQLNHWKKQHRKGILGSIPEDGTTDAQKEECLF